MKFFQLNGNLSVVFRPVVVLLADEHARDHDLRKKRQFWKIFNEKRNQFLPRILGTLPLHTDPVLSDKGKIKVFVLSLFSVYAFPSLSLLLFLRFIFLPESFLQSLTHRN